jgi:CRP-like cAMP-binding protein
LREHVLFKEYANEDFIASLAKQMKPRMFVDGAYIIRKNEIGKAMFFNLKGSVEVISDDGETVINVMEEGSFFGEIGVLYSVPRTVSCRSKGKSIILTLTKEALDDALKPYPQIAKSIALIAEERYESHLKKRESSVGEEFGEELNLAITYNELREVSIFKNASIDFLHKLTLSLKLVKYYQNQYIIKKGDLAKEMYFLVKGTAHVVDHLGTTVFAQFQPGSFFGEMGLLLKDNRRTANVKCASDYVLLFKCEKTYLDQIIEEYPEVKKTIEEEMKRRLDYMAFRQTVPFKSDIALATEVEIIREKLKSVPLFQKASNSFLHSLAAQVRIKMFGPDVVVVKQGDEANSMFFIIDGTVRITALDQSVTYAELSKDSFFGEVSLFYDTNRTASVISKTECTLIELCKKNLNDALQVYPEVKASILNVANENYVAHCARQHFSLGQSCVGPSIEATTEKLKLIHLFRSCDEGFLRSLAVQTTIRVCEENETIFEEGDDSAEMYFVNQGCAQIVSKDHSCVFDTIQSGDFFGEVGILNGWKRTASVKAGSANTILMVLTISDLHRVIQKYPNSLQEIIIAGNQRIEKAKSRNEGMICIDNSCQEGLLQIIQNSMKHKDIPATGALMITEKPYKRDDALQELPQKRKLRLPSKGKIEHGPPSIKHILDCEDFELRIIFSKVPQLEIPKLTMVCRQWYSQLYCANFWKVFDLSGQYYGITPRILTNLVAISNSHLVSLILNDCWEVDDLSLEQVSTNCSNLVRVALQNCRKVTDVGLASIARMNSIEYLNLTHCSKIKGTGFTANSLNKLRSLNISYCPITDRNLEKLVQNTPELETIQMNRCARITDYGLFLIARYCR